MTEQWGRWPLDDSHYDNSSGWTYSRYSAVFYVHFQLKSFNFTAIFSPKLNFHLNFWPWPRTWSDFQQVSKYKNQQERTTRIQVKIQVKVVISKQASMITAKQLIRITNRILNFITAAHRHRTDKYLRTLLANQTARKAMPLTTDKRGQRKMADCPSYY